MKRILLTILLCLASAASACAQGRLVSGNELYFLRSEPEFSLWYHYLKHRIVFDASWPDRGYWEGARVPDYIPLELQCRWPDVVSQGFGVYDLPFVAGYPDNLPKPVPPEGAAALTKTIKAALERADELVWFYSEVHNWLTGAPAEWIDAVESGRVAARSDKKLILLGSFGGVSGRPKNNPQYIAKHIDRLERLPFDGLTVYFCNDGQTYDQGLARRLFSRNKVDVGEILTALQPLKPSRFEYWIEAPAYMAPMPDDEAGWERVIANMKRLGGVIKIQRAKGVNIAGVFMDTEEYETGVWTPKGKDAESQVKKMFDRGRQVIEALDCPVITTIAPIYTMTEGHVWGKAYKLHGPFFAGLAAGVRK